LGQAGSLSPVIEVNFGDYYEIIRRTEGRLNDNIKMSFKETAKLVRDRFKWQGPLLSCNKENVP
jgi:hypothetical protein